MAEALTYTCSCCGETHDGVPEMAFDAPVYYYGLGEEERDRRARLSSDLCTIDNEHFFVRAVLQIPILGTGQRFGWGVWTSLSRENFARYCQTFGDDVCSDGPWFGWLSNRMPIYPDTLSLKLDVHLQNGGQRPLLELHPADHPLVADQRRGISPERAFSIAQRLLHDEAADPTEESWVQKMTRRLGF